MRWNCVRVCQQVLGSCSQSSSTQFDSVGHWKEPHSEWWGDAHARCGRNSRGNGRGSLWLYFHDFWCTLLMFYCASCPIITYHQEKLFCCLVWLRINFQFPIGQLFLPILFHWQAETCTMHMVPPAILEQAGQLKDIVWGVSLMCPQTTRGIILP